jgi:ABC-2 type transport system permease protein
MELTRVGAITLRHARLWFRDKNLFMTTLYWPLFDIVIWGFLGIWMQRTMGNFGTVLLLNIVLWQLFCRSSVGIFWTFVEEIMSNNLSNLFSLPLRLSEWIFGVTAFVILQMSVVISMAAGLVIFFYGVSLTTILKTLALFGPPLFISGLAIGFLIIPIICLAGKRGQEIAFIINWLFTPFSGVFYPVDVLPPFAQKISSYLPMTYVFNGVRLWSAGESSYVPLVIQGYLMAILYLCISLLIFALVFQRTKKTGLARLSD